MASGRSPLTMARIEQAASQIQDSRDFLFFFKWKAVVAILPLWPNPDDSDAIFRVLMGFCLFECGDL